MSLVKISEVARPLGIDNKYQINIKGQSNTSLLQYWDKECVIAYKSYMHAPKTGIVTVLITTKGGLKAYSLFSAYPDGDSIILGYTREIKHFISSLTDTKMFKKVNLKVFNKKLYEETKLRECAREI